MSRLLICAAPASQSLMMHVCFTEARQGCRVLGEGTVLYMWPSLSCHRLHASSPAARPDHVCALQVVQGLCRSYLGIEQHELMSFVMDLLLRVKITPAEVAGVLDTSRHDATAGTLL